jgi:REP-associated tyrosine transposase
MPPKHPDHLRTFGHHAFYRYSLLFRTLERRQVFVAPSPVELVLSQIRRTAVEEQFAVIAYCFMPDHLHLVVEGRAHDSDCRRFSVRSRQYSTFYYLRQYGEMLWQSGALERALRDREQAFKVAGYVLENPVRAGLATTIAEYPFVGSLVLPLSELTNRLYLHHA